MAAAFALAVLLQPNGRARFCDSEAFVQAGGTGGLPMVPSGLIQAGLLLSSVFTAATRAGAGAVALVMQSQHDREMNGFFGSAPELQSQPWLDPQALHQVGLPLLLAFCGLGAALLLRLCKAPRLAMGLSLLHAASFPIGTIAGVFALLWIQHPANRTLFPSEPQAADKPMIVGEGEEERFRRQMGM